MKTYLFILYFITFGSIWAQKPTVVLEVDPKSAESGSLLNIIVKSNVQGEIEIEYPSAYVQGYNVMSGMEEEMDYQTGKVKTIYYFSQTGVINKEGTFTFGPAYVKKGNRTYKSNTVVVKIGKNYSQIPDEITAKQLQKPAFGIIQKNKEELYEGEPLVLSAKIYARFNPTQLDRYQPFSMPGSVKEYPLSSGSRIMVEEEHFKGIDFYSFEYDKKLYFPKAIGTINIDPYKMYLKQGFDAYPLISNRTQITIKPLPSPVPKNFIGGVGNFKLERSFSKLSGKKGDVITMVISVSGEGNLHQIAIPKFQPMSGLKLYGDPKIEEQITFGYKGAEGKITYTYSVLINKGGDISIPKLSLAYFDVDSKKYINIYAPEAILNIEKEATSISHSDQDKGGEEIISQLKTPKEHASKNLVFYLSSAVGVLGLTVFLLLFKRNKRIAISEELTETKVAPTLQNQIIKSLDTAIYDSIDEMEKQLKFNLMIGLDLPFFMNFTQVESTLIAKKFTQEEIINIKTWLQSVDEIKFGMALSSNDAQDLKLMYAEIHQVIINKLS